MLHLLNRFWRWYDLRRRRLDLDILWPTCKRQAEENAAGGDSPGYPPLQIARGAFAVHALHDRAWRRWMSEDEICDFIDTLT